MKKLGVLFLLFVVMNITAYAENEQYFISDQHTEAIEVTPLDWKTYFERGLAYDKADQLEEAIANYTAAIDLDQTQLFPYYNRGLVFNEMERFEEAIEDFTNAIALQSDRADIYYDRARSYHFLGDYESAISDFSKTIDLDPNYIRAYYSRGVAYGRIGEYQLAIDDYSKTILLSPGHVDAYNNRGNVYYRLEMYDAAIADYNQAIALNPDYADAYHNRELAYEKSGIARSKLSVGFDFENSNWSMTVAEVADAEGLSAGDFTDIGWNRGYLEKTGYAFGHPCVMMFNFMKDSFTVGTYTFISEDPMGVYQDISEQIAEQKGETTHNDFERFDDRSTHSLDFNNGDAMMKIVSDGNGACFQRWEDASNEYALVLMRNMGSTDFGVPIVILTIDPLH